MEGIIYCFTNPINDKKYVGLTVHEEIRFNLHKGSSLKGGTPFYDDMKEIGFENFKYSVLERLLDDNQDELDKKLNKLERMYIKQFKSNDQAFGYNRDTGGGYKRNKRWLWLLGL